MKLIWEVLVVSQMKCYHETIMYNSTSFDRTIPVRGGLDYRRIRTTEGNLRSMRNVQKFTTQN